jgi:hypothetical protein
MNKLLQEERDLQDFLTAHGFTVERLEAQQDARTCDFKVTAGGIHYLIEAKRRDDSVEYLESMRKTQSYSGSKKLDFSTSMETIVRNAVAQFKQTPCSAHYKIVWLKLACELSDIALKEVKISLYGIRLLEFKKGNRTFRMDCFYFTESLFFKFKELDAVVLDTDGGLIFFMNDHSNNPYHLLASPLLRLHKMQDGLYFPTQMDEEGRCIFADCDIPRKKTQDLFRFLEKKYGITIHDASFVEEHFSISRGPVPRLDTAVSPRPRRASDSVSKADDHNSDPSLKVQNSN